MNRTHYPAIGEWWVCKDRLMFRKILYMTNFSTDPITYDNQTRIVYRNLLGTQYVMSMDQWNEKMKYIDISWKSLVRKVVC